MQCAKDIHYAQQSAKNNYPLTNTFPINRSEKIIAGAKAIFEGIGVAGLISAAFWYATAPVAPDGFRGHIPIFIISASTIATLFLAIPIAYFSYKNMLKNYYNLHNELHLESQYLQINNLELHYELIQLRSLFNTDDEFNIHLNQIIRKNKEIINTSMIISVCEIFKILKNERYHLKWHGTAWQFPVLHKSLHHFNSIEFKEIIKNKNLSNNKFIRQALVSIIEPYITKAFDFAQPHIKPFSKPKHSSRNNVVYGIVAGITCAEVLLDIGWTVCSIFIGVKLIAPISNFIWVIFAIMCLVAGFLFGFSMTINKQKQEMQLLKKEALKKHNNLRVELRETVNNMFTQRMYHQENHINQVVPTLHTMTF